MPEVGSWKQRVSGIFCRILLLSTITKFIFQTSNALKEISLQEKQQLSYKCGCVAWHLFLLHVSIQK